MGRLRCRCCPGDRRRRRCRPRAQPGPLRPRPRHHHFRYRPSLHQPGRRFPRCRADNRVRRGHRDPFPVRDNAARCGPKRGPRTTKVARPDPGRRRRRGGSPDRVARAGTRALLGYGRQRGLRQPERARVQRAKTGSKHFHRLLAPLRNDVRPSGNCRRGRGGAGPPAQSGPRTGPQRRAQTAPLGPGRRPDGGQAVPSGRAPVSQSTATQSTATQSTATQSTATQSTATQSAGSQSSAAQVPATRAQASQEDRQTETTGR